jgi:hypothetical protein
MTDIDLAGIGIWSERFADWEQFQAVLAGRTVEADATLKPELIPARERRRAPAAVKMAIEVMDQACRMAGQDPQQVATVFGSGMGDMQITDYMCRTLVSAPRMVSPTKFHNSVHNASTGYWSIATGAHGPTNAISAYANTVAAALLEGAVQSVEEQIPVLVAVEELAAPTPFRSVIEVDEPLAVAVLLAPPGTVAAPLARLHFDIKAGPADREGDVPNAALRFPNNFAAGMLPLLAALARQQETLLALPLTRRSTLVAALEIAEAPRSAQA